MSAECLLLDKHALHKHIDCVGDGAKYAHLSVEQKHAYLQTVTHDCFDGNSSNTKCIFLQSGPRLPNSAYSRGA